MPEQASCIFEIKGSAVRFALILGKVDAGSAWSNNHAKKACRKLVLVVPLILSHSCNSNSSMRPLADNMGSSSPLSNSAVKDETQLEIKSTIKDVKA